MSRFKKALAQKVHFHNYLNNLKFKHLHAIDTKHGHTKRLITKHKVHQIGYDFNLPSTTYLEDAKVHPNDVVWLDYCCTPNQPFVLKDLQLCRSKWVFATFSLRGCKYKSQIKYLCKHTPYKVGWTYHYNDTSPMIVVAYYKDKAPPQLINPVGQWYKYKWNGDWCHRQCKKLLLPPKDDTVLYLDLGDSNEPINRCKRTKYPHAQKR